MKYKDLITKTATELEHLLTSERAKLLKTKFDLSDKKLQNVAELRDVRVLIARILTRLQEVGRV